MKHRIGPDGDTLQLYDNEEHLRNEADPYRPRPVLTTWRRRFLEEDIRSGRSVSIAELEMLGLWDPHDDSAVIRSGRARWPLATLVSVSYRGEALGLGGLTAAQEQALIAARLRGAGT